MDEINLDDLEKLLEQEMSEVSIEEEKPKKKKEQKSEEAKQPPTKEKQEKEELPLELDLGLPIVEEKPKQEAKTESKKEEELNIEIEPPITVPKPQAETPKPIEKPKEPEKPEVIVKMPKKEEPRKTTSFEDIEVAEATRTFTPSEEVIKKIYGMPIQQLLANLKARPTPQMVITIFGEKGVGKTVEALSLKGKIIAFSFDKKTSPVKYFYYNDTQDRIEVIDVVDFLKWESHDDKEVIKSAEMAYEATRRILDEYVSKVRPNWILFDNAEILLRILELVMRGRYGLGIDEGVPYQYWRRRKMLFRAIHYTALKYAKYGVIYTTYVQYRQKIVGGKIVQTTEYPNWFEDLKIDSDIVLKVEYDPDRNQYKVIVLSSKYDFFLKSGTIYNVTDKPIGEQINWEEFAKKFNLIVEKIREAKQLEAK